MSAVVTALLAELESAARAAQEAEAALRKQMVAEVARLERQRAFAYRRLNLMRPVTEAVAAAANEEAALANGLATLRAELGWDSESETRSETLARFADVVRAIFASCAETEEAPAAEVSRALAAFESWYAARYRRPFWTLFEQYIPELPLVER
jgi:hypothetical protein